MSDDGMCWILNTHFSSVNVHQPRLAKHRPAAALNPPAAADQTEVASFPRKVTKLIHRKNNEVLLYMGFD